MELSDRETLVKVEQQLNNSIENQTKISQELREFLQKLEKNDKYVGVLRVELKTHLSEAPLRREDLNNKLIYMNKEIEELKRKSEKINKSIEDIYDKIDTEKTERGTFETTVKASVKSFKVFITVIIGLFGFILTLAKLMPLIIKLFS